jgi:hypothetical protein
MERALNTSKLEQRLKEMSSSQLRARCKRLEDHLNSPLTELEALLATLPSPSPGEPQGADDPDSGEGKTDRNEPIGSTSRLRSWFAPGASPSDQTAALERSAPEACARLRDLLAQEQLIEVEFAARGEQRRPQIPNAPAEPRPDTVDRVGQIGRAASERIAEITRQASESAARATRAAAGSAARASSRKAWDLTKAALSPARPSHTPERAVARRRGPKPGELSAVGLIEKLHELYERGILTKDEFEAKKTELLDRL